MSLESSNYLAGVPSYVGAVIRGVLVPMEDSTIQRKRRRTAKGEYICCMVDGESLGTRLKWQFGCSVLNTKLFSLQWKQRVKMRRLVELCVCVL